MISDYSRYYGCVFVQLIEHRPRIVVEKLDVGPQGVYLIDKQVPLYIKFSRRRRGPWAFTFLSDHQICCEELAKRFGHYITAFVCGADGIVALDDAQLREVLDNKCDDQEGVTVRRKLRHMYSVSGTSGKLARKVSNSLVTLIGKLTDGGASN